MGNFGLTDQGFIPMRLSDILLQTTQQFQSLLGAGIDLSSSSPLGQINGILAERESLLWEDLLTIVQQGNPDLATFQNQDDLYSINNVLRLPAIPSTSILTIAGVDGTVIPGTDTSATPFKVSVAGSNHTIIFQATSTVTVAGGTAQVPVSCTVTGPNGAPAGSLSVIETPTTGVTSSTNAADAILGRDRESNTAFRIRRLQELQRSDAATNGGIFDTIVKVPGVTQAGIIENDTDVTDGNGLPPHSIEVFALGGADQDIANAVFAAKAAGIQTYGTTTKTVVDSQGFSHTVSFSRPTPVTIYIVVNSTLVTNPSDGQAYPADGDTQVKNALVAYGQTLVLGEDVMNPQLVVAAMTVVGQYTLTILADIAVVPANWTTGHVYGAGANVVNGPNKYHTVAGGTSAGSGPGPTGQGGAIVDNTVTWVFVADLTLPIVVTPTKVANIQLANITVNS